MSDEIIEISAAEYKAIMGMSAKMAETITAIQEQNQATQEVVKQMSEAQAATTESVKAIGEQMVASAENLTAMFASLVDAIKAIQIINNLPASKSRGYTIIRERGVIVGIQEATDE